VSKDPTSDWDIVVIPDQNLTHSCSNYTWSEEKPTVFTRDDKLVLKITEACEDGKCVNAGRVMSKEAYTYGIFVFKAKVPKCNSIWPAIWMLPGNTSGHGVYGDWPCSGEIDILETVGDGTVGAFNLVAGYGSPWAGCGDQHVCNKCGDWGPFCTSSTMLNDLQGSFYDVQQTDCSVEHPSWDEHTYVLNWQPTKIGVYVDPVMEFEGEKLVKMLPKEENPYAGFPTFKEYSLEQTPTWQGVDDFMEGCYPEQATSGAPFDKPFKIVLNIALGGYGGAKCSWGEDACTAKDGCGGAIGSELEITEIKIYEYEK